MCVCVCEADGEREACAAECDDRDGDDMRSGVSPSVCSALFFFSVCASVYSSVLFLRVCVVRRVCVLRVLRVLRRVSRGVCARTQLSTDCTTPSVALNTPSIRERLLRA